MAWNNKDLFVKTRGFSQGRCVQCLEDRNVNDLSQCNKCYWSNINKEKAEMDYINLNWPGR